MHIRSTLSCKLVAHWAPASVYGDVEMTLSHRGVSGGGDLQLTPLQATLSVRAASTRFIESEHFPSLHIAERKPASNSTHSTARTYTFTDFFYSPEKADFNMPRSFLDKK